MRWRIRLTCLPQTVNEAVLLKLASDDHDAYILVAVCTYIIHITTRSHDERVAPLWVHTEMICGWNEGDNGAPDLVCVLGGR